jgi:hypothetical protein
MSTPESQLFFAADKNGSAKTYNSLNIRVIVSVRGFILIYTAFVECALSQRLPVLKPLFEGGRSHRVPLGVVQRSLAIPPMWKTGRLVRDVALTLLKKVTFLLVVDKITKKA